MVTNNDIGYNLSTFDFDLKNSYYLYIIKRWTSSIIVAMLLVLKTAELLSC